MRTTARLTALVALALLAMTACKRSMHIRDLKPMSGVMAGNETIEIRGSGFPTDMGVTVYFGMERCPTAFVEGTNKIVVTTPTYPKSTLVDVRIIADNGEEIILRKGFRFIKSAKWSPLDAFGAKGKQM